MVIKGIRWPNDNIGDGRVKAVITMSDWDAEFENDQRRYAEDLPHEVIHSPGGFEWGYGGSGPADLAYNILLKVTGMKRITEQHYHKFNAQVISQLSRVGGFEISSQEVWDWLRRNLHPQAPKVIGSLHI